MLDTPSGSHPAATFFLRRYLAVIAMGIGAALTHAAPAAGQVKLMVDPKSSLAWWQITPHLKHLWATTCPEEPSWQPGDVYSIGFVPKFVVSSTDSIVPLYPRYVAQALCSPAVHGEISVADTTTWSGVRGLIVIAADSLVTGFKQRDDFAHSKILETPVYPNVRFQIDSLTNIRLGKTPQDTTEADAVGVLELHGTKKGWVVPIRVWRERLGLRVTGKFTFQPDALVEDYHMSSYPLNLGVQLHIWKLVHLGIDAILVSSDNTGPTGPS